MKTVQLLIIFLFFSKLGLTQCPELLDQQHTPFNQGTSGQDQWQSFTAGISGKLTKVELFKNGIQTFIVTLEIRQGQGAGGTLLFSDNYSFTNLSSGWVNLDIPLGSAPNVTNGSQYTIRLLTSSNIGWTCNTGNLYSNGVYSSDYYGGIQASWDMNFRTYVTPDPPPTVGINSQTNPTCNGGSNGIITTTVGSGTPGYSFSWSPGGQTGQSPSNFSAGTHTVTVTDANGCTATTSTTLNDPPAITVNAGLDQAVCPGGPPITIAGSVTIASGGTWTSTGSGTFGNANSLFTTYDPSPADELAGAVTLTLTSTGNGGCAAVQDQMTLTIHPQPTITGGADQTICDGTSVTLTAINSPGVLSWNNGVTDGVAFTPPLGTNYYVATIVDGNGCTANDSVQIIVNPYPNGTLSCSDGDQIICAGDLVTFSASAGFTTYTFLVDGSPVQGPNNVSTYNTTTLINGETVTVEIESLGCTSTAPQSFTMTVNAVPVASFSPISDNCADGPPYTLVEGGPSPGNYEGPGVYSNIFYPDSVGAGTYTLMYIATSNGCSDTAYSTVNVVPLPVVNAGADQTVCEGDQVTLNGAGASTYVWNQGISNGVAFTPPAGNNVYVVTGTATSGCSATDTVNVTVNQNPTLTITPDITFCAGDTLILTASGADTYNWNSSAAVTSSYQYIPTSSIDIPVTGYNTFGCSSTSYITLTLDDPSVVNAGIDQTICKGFTVSLSASGGVSYLWNGPGILDLPTQDISFQVDTSAYYVVEVTTANGCVYPDSVFITSNNDPTCTIATVTSITPNDDGVNDFWRIEGIESFPNNTVIIYNRWGDEIFNETGYDNDQIKWEGTNQSGETAAGGTYYFLIKIENGPTETGWLQLLK